CSFPQMTPPITTITHVSPRAGTLVGAHGCCQKKIRAMRKNPRWPNRARTYSTKARGPPRVELLPVDAIQGVRHGFGRSRFRARAPDHGQAIRVWTAHDEIASARRAIDHVQRAREIREAELGDRALVRFALEPRHDLRRHQSRHIDHATMT